MRPFAPCLLLGCLLLTVSCEKAGPELDSALLLGVWRQQRHTEVAYNDQGPISTRDVVHSDRWLVFKPTVYSDSGSRSVIIFPPLGPLPSYPYTLQSTVLSVGYAYGSKKYEVRALTAHALALHAVIPPDAFPSSSRPLPAGAVSVSFITDEYFTR